MGEKQLRLEGGDDVRVALAQYDTPPELAARQVAMIGAEWSAITEHKPGCRAVSDG